MTIPANAKQISVNLSDLCDSREVHHVRTLDGM